MLITLKYKETISHPPTLHSCQSTVSAEVNGPVCRAGNGISQKSSSEVRAYIDFLHVIDNQQSLFELSHRLEPRAWRPTARARAWVSDDKEKYFIELTDVRTAALWTRGPSNSSCSSSDVRLPLFNGSGSVPTVSQQRLSVEDRQNELVGGWSALLPLRRVTLSPCVFSLFASLAAERGDVIRFNQRLLRADAAAFSTSAVVSISQKSMWWRKNVSSSSIRLLRIISTL